MRKPYLPYVQMLHRWQNRLKRATSLDEDPYDAPVDLDDVRDAAKRIAAAPDANWH
jgi:hypothetical protein